jgi:two-component system NtrC family response regulator
MMGKRHTDRARILIVEDNEDFCLLLQTVLEDAGYTVDCAACAEDALRMLEERPYRLVVSDYSLPGYSGRWLLSQAFERRLLTPDAALIVTGDPEAPGVAGVVPVVPKPVDFERLLPEIRTAIERGSQIASDGAAA